MMDDINHRDYYHERARTSRRLAERASIPAIRAVQEEFARRYDAIVEETLARRAAR